MTEFLQFLFSGVTIGSIYALAAIGFAIIYNASGVINFAQGEFIMTGGMVSAMLFSAGVPLPLAILIALVVAGLIGMAVEKFAVEPAGDADTVSLIIITIGASIFLQGLAQALLGKGRYTLPAFSGNEPIMLAGATILPQSLWMLGVTCVIVCLLGWFFNRTLLGKALLATSFNPLAARLVGINTKSVLLLSFALSAVLGAIAGAIAAPITLTYYDVGLMLGLKGFVAATLGGLGNGTGAIAGGLILGVTEAMAAGYISSEYKDAVPFILIILILFFLPRGLFGARVTERV